MNDCYLVSAQFKAKNNLASLNRLPLGPPGSKLRARWPCPRCSATACVVLLQSGGAALLHQHHNLTLDRSGSLALSVLNSLAPWLRAPSCLPS